MRKRIKGLISALLVLCLLVGILPVKVEAYTHAKEFSSGYDVYKGIDVSKWDGVIDWKKVSRAGIQFAFIRCGNTYSSSFTMTKDPQLDYNLKNAQKYGIKTGVYYFSQATTTAEARKEAQYVLKLLKGYKLDLEVFYDVEDVYGSDGKLSSRFQFRKFSKAACTSFAMAFCDTIKAGGYKPGVYNSVSTFSGNAARYDGAAFLKKGYPLWVARYANTANSGGYNVSGYSYWQYSNKGKVNGINADVDLNFWYRKNSAYPDVQVCVEEEDDTAITGLALNRISVALAPGTSAALSASVNPAGTKAPVLWTSDREDIAFVSSSGVVTAVQNGTATITASSADGKVKASCTVTVGGVNPAIVKTVTYGDNDFSFTIDDIERYQAVSNDVVSVTADGCVSINGAGVATVYAYPNDLPESVPDTPEPLYTQAEPIAIRIVVQRKSMNQAVITGLAEQYKYTGDPISPKLSSVTVDNVTLTADDYTCFANKNTNRGLATLWLTGKGNYQGSVGASFSIRSNQNIWSKQNTYTAASGGSAFTLMVKQLSQYGSPLTFKSSDTSVATVTSSGKVTPKNPGTAVITIAAAQNARYNAASRTITITVTPKKAALSTLTAGKKKLTAKWKAVTGNGYQLQYSTSKSFSSAKTLTLNSKATSTTISNLKSGKTYYVRIRAYSTLNGKSVYGEWSAAKSQKVK